MVREKPEREEKEEEEGSGRKVGGRVKTPPPDAKLGAKIYGAKLGARIYGAELPAKSPSRLRRAQDLSASNDGAKKCKLGASNDDAELRVHILKSYLHIYKKKAKK